MTDVKQNCSPESCACHAYRPRDDGEEECHCGCPECDNAITDDAGLERFAEFCGDLAQQLRVGGE